MPQTLRVEGDGTEMHAVRVDATLGEIHEALVLASARRVTSGEAEAAGLEVLVLDERTVDGLIRAVRAQESPALTWMGVPVRWHKAASGEDCSLHVRSWPIITEIGPRSVVEVCVYSKSVRELRDEVLLVPGEALALTTGGVAWPAALEATDPPASPVATALEWGASCEGGPLGLILLVPRVDASR
jgi:hypothetical protein